MKKRLGFLYFLSAATSLFSNDLDVVNRVNAFLTIKDPFSASDEALEGLQTYPMSLPLWEVYIKAQGQRGDEVGMLVAWEKYRKLVDPKVKLKSEVLENVAWGIIQNGSENSSPIIRLYSLLAALYGDDARSVDVICKGLEDSHAGVRAAAAEIGSQMRDGKLCEAILERLKTENDVTVRVELIKAAGRMEIKEAQPYLMQLIAQPGTRADHRAVAIEALMNLLGEIEPGEISKFAQSDRAGLRLLACECAAYSASSKNYDHLVRLATDSNSDVRAAALQTLGLLDLSDEQNRKVIAVAEGLSNDPDHAVGISAAWLLTLKSSPKGQPLLRKWLANEAVDVRLHAAGALNATGKYGRPLLDEAFANSRDKLVRVNLALGMIASRINSTAACEVLQVAMAEDKGRWMKEDKGLFSYIGPSKVKFKEGVPNYPEAVNQIVRLELINMMAMLRYPLSQQVMTTFLRERAWGVTGLAAAQLLTEGDEEAIKIVESVLKDPQPKVRAQAALILGLWGGDEAAMKVLVESYASGTRDLKEQILEAMGNIKSPLVVPFLVDRLNESSQTLRLLAAMSLLRSLNH